MPKQFNQQGRGTKKTNFAKTALPGMGSSRSRATGNRGAIKGNLKLGSALKNSKASTKISRANSNISKESKAAGGQTRDKSTLKRLNLYRQKAPTSKQLHAQELKPVRIEPDRRWFGNTRVVSQGKMSDFREQLSREINDPFKVVLKSSKLPMSLLTDSLKNDKMDLLKVESFADTFGKNKKRKRVKLSTEQLELPKVIMKKMREEEKMKKKDNNTDDHDIDNDQQPDTSLAALLHKAQRDQDQYRENQVPANASGREDKQIKYDLDSGFSSFKAYEGHDQEEVFLKGTSKRIWRETYKVIDSSDVILMILDARDPLGTRCINLEKQLKKNHPHKHIVFILNKCDLVPNWVVKKWIDYLRKERPTLAFKASVTNPFGKQSLIQLLRQFSKLICSGSNGSGAAKKHLQIGLLGYPNVGKSSVINALKKKSVCKSAPVPGETRVWQYIAMTKKIFMIDCPGIVPMTSVGFKEDTAKVLKGVVRAEKLESPSAYIDEVVSRVKSKYLISKYNLDPNNPKESNWSNGEEFLEILAKKMGKLRRGGDADIETCARIVLYDWQRGRLPFFCLPPGCESEEKEGKDSNGEGKTGTTDSELKVDNEGKEELATGKSDDDDDDDDELDTGIEDNDEEEESNSDAESDDEDADIDAEVARQMAEVERGEKLLSEVMLEAKKKKEEKKSLNKDLKKDDDNDSNADSESESDIGSLEDVAEDSDEEEEDNSDEDADEEGSDADSDDDSNTNTKSSKKSKKDKDVNFENIDLNTLLKPQDLDQLDCKLEYDPQDAQGQGNTNNDATSKSESNLTDSDKKSLRMAMQRKKREKRIEKEIAMNSDDSDVDELHESDSDDEDGGGKGRNSKKGVTKGKATTNKSKVRNSEPLKSNTKNQKNLSLKSSKNQSQTKTVTTKTNAKSKSSKPDSSKSGLTETKSSAWDAALEEFNIM